MKYKWIFLVMCGFCAALTGTYIKNRLARQEIRIAYIDTRVPGVEHDYLSICDSLLDVYTDNLSQSMPKLKFTIDKFHNHKSDSIHEIIYDSIIDAKYSIIIDNGHGIHLRKVESAIKKIRIPVIAMNGDHNNIDYGKFIHFLAYDDDVPNKLAAVTSRVLSSRRAIVIGSADSAPVELLKDILTKDSVTVTYIPVNKAIGASADEQHKYRDSIVKDVIDTLRRLTNDGDSVASLAIVLHVHSDYGKLLLRNLAWLSHKAKIVAPIFTASDTRLLSEFEPKNELEIYTVSNRFSDISIKSESDVDAIIYDIENQVIPSSGLFQHREYEQRMIDVFNILSYALQDFIPKGQASILERISSLKKSPSVHINGIDYSFNEYGHLRRSYTVIRVSDVARPHFTQLDQDLQPRSAVLCGAWIRTCKARSLERDVFDIEIEYSISFESNLDTDNNLSRNIETLLHVNTDSKVGEDIHIGSTTSHGVTESRYIRRMTIPGSFNYLRYPLDRQVLKLRMDFISQHPHWMIVVSDAVFNRYNNAQYTIPSYSIGNAFSQVSIESGASILPQNKRTITMNIPLERLSTAPLMALALPSFLISLIAISLMLGFRMEQHTIVQAGVSLLLVAITSSIPLVGITPQIGSLKLLDTMYLLMLYVVVASCGLALWRSRSSYSSVARWKFLAWFVCLSYPVALLFVVVFWK